MSLVTKTDRIADLERQVAALKKERDEAISFWQGSDAGWADDQRKLVASQAREQTLRELWEAVEKEYFARLKEQDEEAAKFEVEKDMYGWNFHKGLSGGLVKFHIYMTKIAKALALPQDDTALQARLAEEHKAGYAAAIEAVKAGMPRYFYHPVTGAEIGPCYKLPEDV